MQAIPCEWLLSNKKNPNHFDADNGYPWNSENDLQQMNTVVFQGDSMKHREKSSLQQNRKSIW